jgi:TolB protein
MKIRRPPVPRPARLPFAAARSAPPVLLLAVALALPLASAVPAVAQPPQERPQTPTAPSRQLPEQGEATVILEGGRSLLRLAFPPVTGGAALSGEMAAAAREVEDVLRADLDFADLFQIQGPEGFDVLELTGERATDFELYRSLGNEYLIQADVLQEGDRFVFEGRLFDLADGTAVVAKRYRGNASVARRIAHTFGNEVVRGLTGEQGIFLTSITFTSDRSGFKEIYRMDYDGANVQEVTAHKSTSMSSAWKPDASGIAYVSFFSGAPAIYFAALPSGAKSPLVTQGSFNISPNYSPDGRKLVFTRSLGGNSEIYVAAADGDHPRRLTHTEAIDTNAAWSPSGAFIAFTSSRAGNPHLYLMDAEGTNLRRLTFEGDYNDGAAWSPEGDEVVYATRRQAIFQIAITNVVTLETRLVTSGYGNKEDPQFAPDGRHIVFTSNQTGTKQLYVMDADGGDIRRLTRQGNNESPAWSPVAR